MPKSPNTPKQIPNPKKLRGAAIDDIHHLAFDNSVQANLVTRSGTGKILIANRAACRLLGYSKKELLTKNRADIADITGASFKRMLKNRKAQGHSTAWVTMIKKDGRRIPCEVTSATFKGRDGNENGIFTITNMSQRILKQKNIDAIKEKIVAHNILLAQKRSAGEKLHYEMATRKKLHKEFKENFRLTFNASSDVLYDSNLLTDEVLINNAYEKDFGYKITKHMRLVVDWAGHIHPNDKDAVYKNYTRMLASKKTEWKCKYRFLKADGSVANVVSRAIVLRDDAGKAYRLIGYMKDLSKQKVLEEKLEMEIKLKEIQIKEAAVEAKETERSDIGKELHANQNYIEDSRVNTLRRFFLLSFTYNLTKTGLTNSNSGGGIRIMR